MSQQMYVVWLMKTTLYPGFHKNVGWVISPQASWSTFEPYADFLLDAGGARLEASKETAAGVYSRMGPLLLRD